MNKDREDWTRVRFGLELHECPPNPVELVAGRMCSHSSPKGYPCRRYVGHTGRHFAGYEGRIVAVWR